MPRFLTLVTFSAAAMLVAASPLQAQAVAKADPRAMAMGGGYVALADGWAALQWNPAGMWVSGRNEAAVTLGNVPLEGGPWVEALRAARGYSDALDGVTAAATLASRSAGLAGERVFGAYIVSLRFGGAFQQIDYTDEVTRVRDGGVEIDMASLRTREFQFSAAHPFMQGRLVIGGSAKLVQAQGRFQSVPVDSQRRESLTVGKLLARSRSGAVVTDDTVFAVDIGVLLIPSAKFRLGGVVKNVNAPDLGEVADPITRLPRQIRIGGLLLPHPSLKLTIDFDLTTDVFVAGGRKRRELGGGLEWSGGGLAMRGGVLFDMQAVELQPMYTLGIGLGGETLRADLAGSWAPDLDGFGWLGALAASF